MRSITMFRYLILFIGIIGFSKAFAQPANNECINATSLTVGATCNYSSYTTLAATVSAGIPAPGCGSTTFNDVWFSVTVPASGGLTIVTDTGSITNGAMALYSGSCGALSLVECDDDDSPINSMPAIALNGLTPGSTIYIRFWKKFGGTGGTFKICVTDFTAPSNDECAGAITIPVNSQCNFIQYNNIGATASVGVPASGCGGTTFNDVWFKVTVPASGNLIINSNTGTLINGAMAIYSGTCGALTLIECDDNDSPNGNMPEIMRQNFAPGSDLYIRFWENNTTSIGGTFSLCVYEGAPVQCTTGNPTPNDTCINAPYICNLDGFCGYTYPAPTYTVDNPGFTSSCGFSLDNNSWMKFVASSSNVSLDVWIYGCTLDYGIQIGIFNGNCTSGFSSVSCATNPSGNDTVINFNVSGLTVGQTYFMMVDGYAGDVCGYTIKANYGVLTVNAGNDTTICEGSTFMRTATGIPGLTFSWYNDAAHISLISTGAALTVNPTLAQSPKTYYLGASGNPLCPTNAVLDSFIVTVNPTVGVPVFTLGATSLCKDAPNETYTATATGSTTITYSIAPVAAGTINAATGSVNWSATFTGTATITATANGCNGSNTNSVLVTINNYPTVNIGVDAGICLGNTLTLDAGNAGSTYHWNDNSANQTLVVSAAGTYAVTVTNSAGCASSDNLNITLFALPVVNLGNDTAICVSTSISLNAGNTGSTYNWSNGTHNQTLSVSAAGNYSVTVINANNCSASDNINIALNSVPVVNLGNDTSICAGLSITLNAGNSGSIYNWSNGTHNQNLSVSIAGNYAVSVINPQGCTSSDNINISLNPLPVAAISPVGGAAICNGGSVTLTAAGGTGYLWNTTETTQSIIVAPLANTNYSVTVSNSCGTDVASVPVNVNTTNATITATLGAICSGQSTTLTAGGAATYLWSNGASTQSITISPSADADYYVTVSGNGCLDSTSIHIVVKPNVTAVVSPTTICAGQTTMLSVSGGTTYLWSTGETLQTIQVSPLISVNYSVTVSAAGCADTAIVPVTVHSLPVVHLGNDTTICANGLITLNANNLGANYLWSPNGETAQTVQPLVSGQYIVTVTNSFGCAKSDTINLTIHSVPVVNLGNDTTVCQGSTVTLNAGNAGSTYNWSNSSHNQTLLTSTTGLYSVTVINSFSCSASDAIQINVNPVPIVNLGNDTAICAGATIILNAGNAGSTYQWNMGGTGMINSITVAGTYSVTVTNSFNCSASDNINIAIHAVPVVNLGNDTSICFGNTVVLNAGNAGATYQWNIAGTTAIQNISTSGTFNVIVTNAQGCTQSDNIVLTINPLPVVNLGNDTSICSPNTVILNAGNAGSTYIWTGGTTTQTIQVGSPGTYFVTVTNANNCVESDNINIIVNGIPSAPIVVTPVTYCQNVAATALTAAGSNLLWYTVATSGTSNAIAPIPLTTFVGTVSYYVSQSVSGCESSRAQINVVTNAVPGVPIVTTPVTYCQNVTATALSATGSNLLWYNISNGGVGSVSAPIPATTVAGTTSYYVSQTNNSCESSRAQINVVVNVIPSAPTISTPISYCENNSANALTAIGANLLWYVNSNGGTGNVTAPTPITTTVGTTLFYVSQSVTGCESARTQIEVIVNANPVVSFNGALSPQCADNTTYLLTGGLPAGGVYSGIGVSGINFNASVTSAGNHTISYTFIDANSCFNSATNSITVHVLPTAFAGNDTSVCSGQTVILTATGGTSYQWNNSVLNGVGFVPSSTLTYAVTTTDINGCSDVDNVTVTVAPSPIVNAGTDASICPDSDFTLSGSTSNYTSYHWSTTGNGTFVPANSLTPIYKRGSADFNNVYLILSANSSCGTGKDTMKLFVYPKPNISASEDQTIAAGQGFTLQASGGITYSWIAEFGPGCSNCQAFNVDPRQTTSYFLSGTDVNNCIGFDTIKITVNAENEIFIPSAFSPNGDNYNDVLFVRGHGIETMELLIFSRWGEIVFESNSILNGWDGTSNFEKLNPGVFVYFLKVTFMNGERIEKKGNITLVR